MKPWVVVLTCIASVANIALFVFWLSVSRLQAVGPDGHPTDSYDAISTQLTILSISVSVVGIGLALAGVFGYQALREAVLRRADELINERKKREESSSKQPEPKTNEGAVQPPEDDTVPEGDEL